eukprot:47792_1
MSTQKPFISFALFGAKDSGKSTLMGSFIYQLGGIDERTVSKLERESNELNGDPNKKYAFISDSTKLERSTNQSVYNSTWQLYTNKYEIAITDTPGNLKYKSSKIRGISHSDIGILVISAVRKNDNKNINNSKQLKIFYKSIISYWLRQNKLLSFPNELIEIIVTNIALDQFDDVFFDNLLICKTFLISKLIIIINKMDLIKFNENKYNNLKQMTQTAIKQYFKYHNISINICIIPMCALFNHNLYRKSNAMKWYKGNTLLETIENIKISNIRNQEIDNKKPLRMSVNRIEKIGGVGIVIECKIFQGILKPNQEIKILFPAQLKEQESIASVFSIERFHRNINKAVTGELIGVNIKLKNAFIYKQYKNKIPTGSVVVLNNNENIKFCKKCISFIGLIKIFHVFGTNYKKKHEICIGYEVSIYIHLCIVPCKLRKIIWKKSNNNKSFLNIGDESEVIFEPLKPIFLEPFDDCNAFGTFIGMNSNRVVLIGKVKQTTFQ